MKGFIEKLKEKLTDLVLIVKDLVTKPKMTWEQMLTHDEPVSALIKERLLYYAAIPALATFLGTLLFGYRIPFPEASGLTVVHRLSIGSLLVRAIFQYGLTIGGLWVTGRIISYLAPRFGGVRDDAKGFKVAFYSSLPAMLAGALYLIPPLSVITILVGIYGLYLMYIGLPLCMQTPKEKSLLYFVAVIAITLVVYVILAQIFAGIQTSGESEFSSFFEST